MTFWLERVKWPERPHYRYEIVPLGDDDHGDWFAFPPDNPIFRDDELLGHAEGGGVVCVKQGRTWTAAFDQPREGRLDIYCDIITPLEWRADRVWCVDLDLDVLRWTNRAVELVDEDELAEHRVLYGYPDELVELAERVAREVFEMVDQRHPPFDGSAERWIEMRDSLYVS